MAVLIYLEAQTACNIKFGPAFSERKIKIGKPDYHLFSLQELMPTFLFSAEFTFRSKTSFSLFLQLYYFKLQLFLSKHSISLPLPKKEFVLSVLLLQPEPTTDFSCRIPLQVVQDHSKGIALPLASVVLRLRAAHSVRPQCHKTVHIFISLPRGMNYLTVVDFQSLKFKSCLKGIFRLRYAMFSEKIIQGSEYIVSGEIRECFYSILFDH